VKEFFKRSFNQIIAVAVAVEEEVILK